MLDHLKNLAVGAVASALVATAIFALIEVDWLAAACGYFVLGALMLGVCYMWGAAIRRAWFTKP